MHKNTINITLPDGTVKTFPRGITSLEIAQHISEGLAREVLAALVNGVVWDATRPISEDATVQLLTWQDEAGKKAFWHSSAHLLAEALEAFYPGIKLGIGPPIDQGFYYDIDFGEHAFDASHLPKVEAKMLDLARQKNPYQRIEISKAAAIKHFQAKGDPYKLALLEELADGEIALLVKGNFSIC